MNRQGCAALLAGALVATAVACGGEGDDDDVATTGPEGDATAAVVEEPWEDDAQAVLDSAIAPGGIPFGPDGAVADGAVLGVQFPDGRQYVLTTGVDTDATPVEADGTFLAVAFSRVVVEMALWELVEAGEIELDVPIDTWVPTIPNADEITLEMVLNHTSGMGSADVPLQDALLAGSDRAWSLEESIEVLSQIPPAGDPGTTVDVDDHGAAVIIGYVLEEVTGRPLDELVADHVTEPLGLESVGFTTLDTILGELGRVVDEDGTNFDINPYESNVNGEAFLTGGAPAWGIHTDMADLLGAFDALVTGALPGPDQAPRPASFPPDRYTADRPDLVFGIDTPLVAYCPCAGGPENQTPSSYGRSGAIAGTSLSMLTFPDSGISMAIRLNANPPEALADLRRVLHEVHDLITT